MSQPEYGMYEDEEMEMPASMRPPLTRPAHFELLMNGVRGLTKKVDHITVRPLSRDSNSTWEEASATTCTSPAVGACPTPACPKRTLSACPRPLPPENSNSASNIFTAP